MAAASAAFFTSACGGGGGDKRTLALYGDSLPYGSIPGGRLPVTPAQRLAELTGCPMLDYTAGGATLRMAFNDPVPPGWPGLSLSLFPHGRFPDSLLARPADVLVMRFGGADYLLGTDVERFADLYRQAVQAAHLAGCVVVLAGLYSHPLHPGLDAFDAAAARIAAETGARWVDLRTLVPLAYPGDLVDGLHGTQDTSDRWMAATAAVLRGVL